MKPRECPGRYAMQIQLGNYSGDAKSLRKTLKWTATLEGTLKESCSVVDPVVVVSRGSFFPYVNYMYIPAFSRFYFINDMIVQSNNKIEIRAHVDVLMTYFDDINRASIRVEKCTQNLDGITEGLVANGGLNTPVRETYEQFFNSWGNLDNGAPIEDGFYILTYVGG